VAFSDYGQHFRRRRRSSNDARISAVRRSLPLSTLIRIDAFIIAIALAIAITVILISSLITRFRSTTRTRNTVRDSVRLLVVV
jgi:hypothetical protein